MKNSSKCSKFDSPKTPGGISKSLLTPCRRLGLSRNIRKSGASPFQSPLSSNTEVKSEKLETRKRKESLDETPQTPDCSTSEVNDTPTRHVDFPRRKKSKALLVSISKSVQENEPTAEDENESKCELTGDDKEFIVSTPVRLKTRSKSKKIYPSMSTPKELTAVENSSCCLTSNVDGRSNNKTDTNIVQTESKENSPNSLTKECTVVIQKKIFKNELKDIQKPKTKENTEPVKDTKSQTLFDSDSDEVPLNKLQKETSKKTAQLNLVDEDYDFTISKAKISKSNTKHLKLKSNKSQLSEKNKNTSEIVKVEVHKSNSQSSVEDDDFFETKRTILIRKSYDKVKKPQKAKSTGSITQKDIDDLRARIETKKKLLLARAMTEDTKELRDLIKKWQKGCQDALMELMDLMKSKFPDKQNMEYSELLQTLKIPASLVGYDSDNDSFVTPDDERIILANVKD